MNPTKILGEAVGIQRQDIIDQTEEQLADSLSSATILGRFRRGRLDKPMTIHQGNIRGQLGYDPKNPDYIAVQDCLDTDVPFVGVLRLKPESKIPADDVLRYKIGKIDRFAPAYWRVDGGNTASFSIYNYMNGFEVYFISRMTDDLVGVLWDTRDTKDHKLLSYSENADYSELIWDFDIELSDTMPELNNQLLAPTLTVRYIENGEEKVAYIALYNYANSPGARTAHISINWDEVKAGFNADVDFPVTNITQIFFSAVTSGYVGNKVLGADGYPTGEEHSGVPLDAPKHAFMRITNSVVTGKNSQLNKFTVQVAPHDYGVCTSYDDHYDLNPQRIVDNLAALGYQGFINHYCGMSHYPEMVWDTEVNKWTIPNPAITTDAIVVNDACTKWHTAFSSGLNAANMQPVYSVSFEMYSLAGNEYWAQKDINDNLGRTGYEPPSYFFSLSNTEAIKYLHTAFLEFAKTMVDGGCDVNMQIGEPWWWYNTATNLPCIYDYSTKLAFNADTGLYAPDLGTIYEAVNKTDETSIAFKTWLRNKLGQTCKDIKTAINAVYPNAKVCPLIFFPSIRTHQESLVTYINYPVEHYSYPNFDYVMTEAYDWILEGRLDLTHSAVAEIPINELGYPPEKVAYLSGFVPDSTLATVYNFDKNSNYREELWRRILGDMQNNAGTKVMKQMIWAYPQVMQDSITYDSSQPAGKFFIEKKITSTITDNTPLPDDVYLN